MERIKQMRLKKALFTIAFINTLAALILSLVSVWGCARVRSLLAPLGTVLNINADLITTAEIQGVTAQAVVIYESISAVQVLLPILIYMAALFATASMFYRLKLKEPLAELTRGASRMIDNDLDFVMEAKSQDELGQLCAAFETMRRTLLANNRELWRQAEERKRLNAAFSHNLRNPVTVLKGSVKLARNSIADGEENKEQLDGHLLRIESYTDRIEQYVETMSSVQKLEEITARREPAQWSSLISELENITGFARMDSPKQIMFTADACQEDILIDKSILFQIAENLISNALRFAKQRIDVRCSVADGRLLLSVTDDGCGFPDKLIRNGIRPFQKGSEDAGHFGMGLYTCGLLCEKHGGSITIRNNPTGAVVSAALEIV